MGEVRKTGVSVEEFEKIMSFTRDPGWANTKNRVAAYIGSDEGSRLLLKASLYSAGTLTSATLAGAGVGAVINGPQGAAVGATIAFVGSLVIVLGTSGMYVRSNYNRWLREQEGAIVVREFRRIHEEHPHLSELKGPVSLEVLQDPAALKCGHVFERRVIVEILDQQNSCPCCRADASSDQITISWVSIGKLKRAYSKILEEEESNPTYSEPVREAFRCLAKDFEKQAQTVFKNASLKLSIKLNEGTITPNAFNRATRELGILIEEGDPVKSKTI